METKTLTANLNHLEHFASDISIDTLTTPNLNNLASRLNSYYRSKIFTSQIGINPLITAASPLFSIIERLKNVKQKPDLSQLHQDLVHEIKAFETRAQTDGYRSQLILAARYAICAWIDEMILHTHWGKDSEWEKRTLLNNLQGDTASNSQFFILLERCSRDPAIHIDLLELMYLCLSLGFEGDYRYLERGHKELTAIIDNLYQCIRQYRGDISTNLEIKTENATRHHRIKTTIAPLLAIMILCISACITLYLILNHRLDNSADAVYQTLHQLIPASSRQSGIGGA